MTRLIGVVCLLLLACEEPINRPIPALASNVLVVEGVITSENMNHEIKLTRPITAQNEVPAVVTGATLTVSDGITAYSLTEFPGGSGRYYTPIMRAVSGHTYTLSILLQGKMYVAVDSPVPVEDLTPLAYHNSENQYELTLSNEGQNPNYIRHLVSWASTGSCIAGSSCIGEIISYDLKSLDANELFKPGKEPFTFPLHSVVVRTKYSVSVPYRTFLRAMLSETEWRGGVFDVERSDVPTNLSEGAVGFFATSTVVSDTTVIE